VNFTREPIIETIITPKEGFTLIIRNSHGVAQEEYAVSSVEVVSFGKAFFFRSLEKPKAFLLPVSDYEVVEARETRTVLKKPQIDKSIKIGGGKSPKAKAATSEEAPADEQKKKQKSKTSRRRRTTKKEEREVQEVQEEPATVSEERPAAAPPPRRTLLPPPTSLISDQISRYKEYLTAEGAMLPEELKTEEESKVEPLPTEETSMLPEEAPISSDKEDE